MFQSVKSFLDAENFESESIIHSLETRLWQTGVRPHSPEDKSTQYLAARSRDPDFSNLRGIYTQLARLYRQKGERELELAGIYRQVSDIEDKLEKVRSEYARIRDQETHERIRRHEKRLRRMVRDGTISVLSRARRNG